jgi:hypothetical protein
MLKMNLLLRNHDDDCEDEYVVSTSSVEDEFIDPK